MSTSSSTRRCIQFSLEDIKAATNEFDSSNFLGKGGEAMVYFAEIYIGSKKTPVAVKHLNAPKTKKDNTKEFESEIQTLAKIQHPNIISLIGYCNESGQKILVYEYMENGCLSDYLKKKKDKPLSWLQRLNICLDVARGLQHLHSEIDEFGKGIIHRDVKPGNILVGENWVGKLSDFGMLKLSNSGQLKSSMVTDHKGTAGYYAPEYLHFGRVTRKIDVYAFGVVLFQVLCEKSPWDREDESYYFNENEDLGIWAQKNFDAQIRREMSGDSFTLFTDIIGRSLQGNPGKRPTMEKVVLDLENVLLECQESENQPKQLDDTEETYLQPSPSKQPTIDESLPLSPRYASPLSTFATSSDMMLVDSGLRFILMVKDIVEPLTHLVILLVGGNILTRISELFDKYMDALIKELPGPIEDDHLAELKEAIPFRAETDSQQLALLGTAFTIAEELLPMVVSKIWSVLNESKEVGSTTVTENIMPSMTNPTIEFKDWRRQLQHSLDKLRDHFCRQYVLSFIYSRDGKTRLDVQIYTRRESEEDLFWDSDPLPSLPFQALFGKLQQLATVAGDVLLGKEKIQKVLLARLTETVVMWLSIEHEFWGVLEDESAILQPLGLQQLILDMHFTVEIARFAGYPSRHVHQIASAIITRAIRTFSGRGIDPQRALPEDEWFVETAKAAINKLLMGASGSDTSEIDEEHIILHDEVNSDSDESPSSLSTVSTFQSFASAEAEELESPGYLTDPET